jgi:hypothetical protein
VYLLLPAMLLRHHALAVVAVHVESATVMDVACARFAASVPAPLDVHARLPPVLFAAFPGLVVMVVTSGTDCTLPSARACPSTSLPSSSSTFQPSSCRSSNSCSLTGNENSDTMHEIVFKCFTSGVLHCARVHRPSLCSACGGGATGRVISRMSLM